MTAPAAAARFLAARNLRRLAGCGCVAAVTVVVLPLFVLFTVASGMLQAFGIGTTNTNQADTLLAGGAGVVIGAGEPIAPGHFSVSQGFGCTTVSLEGPPPAAYTCPPGGQPAAVRFHGGIDLAAALGQPVLAVTAGSVHVISSATGFGLHIVLIPVITGPSAAVYLYGHLSGVAVPDGDAVRAGAPIGFVGTTGNSSGPHLHFEVDVGGVPVNPCSVFPPGYLVPAGVAAAGCLATAM
jgi:murein DD-endopeptidase MepM/ murein hydrolase activator NlpD